MTQENIWQNETNRNHKTDIKIDIEATTLTSDPQPRTWARKTLPSHPSTRIGRWRHSALRYVTLHHTTLHDITSHYITLRLITLHYMILRHITLRYVTLRYTTLHDITSHYITLRYTTSRSPHYVKATQPWQHRYHTPHHTTIHYITLYYSTLQYITLHYSINIKQTQTTTSGLTFSLHDQSETKELDSTRSRHEYIKTTQPHIHDTSRKHF